MNDDIPVAGEPSRLDRFATALTESAVGGTELGMVQLYKVGEGLVPLNRTVVESDVEPSEIRFVVNPHDHGAEATFVVSITELDSPASPFPLPGPEEIRRPGVGLFVDADRGPQLWYSDGRIAYRMDEAYAPYGPEVPSPRNLAIMDALLKLALDRVQELRYPDPR